MGFFLQIYLQEPGVWQTHTHTHTHTHNEDLLMRFSYFTCQGQERGEISCGLEAS